MHGMDEFLVYDSVLNANGRAMRQNTNIKPINQLILTQVLPIEYVV